MIRTVRLLGTVCALVAAPVAGAQAPDPEVINAAWLERQQKVISAEFDIRVEAFYSKDAISAQIANSPFQPSRMKGHTIPAEDRHCVYTARFVLHGRKLRLEVDGDRWTGSHFGQFGETFVFTERGKRELQNDPARSPAGYVRNQADYLQARLETFRPLTRCLRAGGADAIDDLSAGLLAPAGQKAAIKGVECLPFRETASGDGVRTYWLCPSRDWVLARETFTIPASGARTEFDTAFVRHESGVWVPSSWEVRTTFAGKPTSMTKKFTVVKYTLNGEPERGAFDLSFPVGTNVLDENWSRYVTGVVQADGSYQPHPRTDPAVLETFKAEQRAERNWWLFGGGAALIAVGVAVAVVRVVVRRRKRV